MYAAGPIPPVRLSQAGILDPHAKGDYRRWREWKLAGLAISADDLLVEVRDPFRLSQTERAALTARLARANMALYALGRPFQGQEKAALKALCAQLGLRRLDRNLCADEDGIASLRMVPKGRAREYIPYSNRAIGWHTDGYYNVPGEQVRAFALHCVSDALSGGENGLLDPELVYLQMRDENADYVAALMRPDAMRIPANVENGVELRPARAGPVFSVSGGSLHMRYTARTRSIEWRRDPMTRAAVAFLETLLQGTPRYSLRHRLAPGQGLVCNNVLHTREAFTDAPDRERLYLRARFFDRALAGGRGGAD